MSVLPVPNWTVFDLDLFRSQVPFLYSQGRSFVPHPHSRSFLFYHLSLFLFFFYSSDNYLSMIVSGIMCQVPGLAKLPVKNTDPGPRLILFTMTFMMTEQASTQCLHLDLLSQITLPFWGRRNEEIMHVISTSLSFFSVSQCGCSSGSQMLGSLQILAQITLKVCFL